MDGGERVFGEALLLSFAHQKKGPRSKRPKGAPKRKKDATTTPSIMKKGLLRDDSFRAQSIQGSKNAVSKKRGQESTEEVIKENGKKKRSPIYTNAKSKKKRRVFPEKKGAAALTLPGSWKCIHCRKGHDPNWGL